MLGRYRIPLFVTLGLIAVVAVVAATAVWTAPSRDSVRAYTDLLAAANRQDVDAASRLCTKRYTRTHTLRPARDGGLVNLPRNIHKNFQVWRHGRDVWFCPNREGPIFQFVREAGSWRFDGPVGLLRGRGQVIPFEEVEANP